MERVRTSIRHWTDWVLAPGPPLAQQSDIRSADLDVGALCSDGANERAWRRGEEAQSGRVGRRGGRGARCSPCPDAVLPFTDSRCRRRDPCERRSRQLRDDRWVVAPSAAYLHYVTNETVEGLQFGVPEETLAVPPIADMSSDFLSKPLAADHFAMIYAHAQKNLGPACVPVALIDRAMLVRIPSGLPQTLDPRTQIAHRSNYNTPPVFAIDVLTLVTRWLRNDIGGLAAMQRINEAKAQRLYGTLDAMRNAVTVHAASQWRSQMNAAFAFGDERLDREFIARVGERGIAGLEGRRSLGGLRASLYNAVTLDAVETLCKALSEFGLRHA